MVKGLLYYFLVSIVIFSGIEIGSDTMLLGKISKAQEVETMP